MILQQESTQGVNICTTMVRGIQFVVWLTVLCRLTCVSAIPVKRTNDCAEAARLNAAATRFIFTLPDSAFLYANQAVQAATAGSCLQEKADSHHIIGTVFYHQGVYQEAMHHLLEAAEGYKQLGDKKRSAENLNQLGLVYYNIKQPDLALQEHLKALNLYEVLQDENGIAYSYGCLGHLYEKKKDYTQALAYQQKALAYYEKSNDRQGMATILENIGSIYEDQENYSLAQTYFTRSLHLNELANDSLAMIVNINNIGDSYRKTNQYPKAVEWTKKAVELAARLKDKYQLSSAYRDLSKIYGLSGDYENAYKNLEVGRTLYQEMYARDASRQLALFQTLFEIERKNHAIETLEADQKLSTTIKITLGTSLVLIAMLGGVIISRQRLNIRRNKELIEQNKQIYETRHKLMQAEIENTHLHEQKLQHELDAKAKSLTSHTLHIISKNKTLEDIQQKLSDLLKDGPTDNRKQLKAVVKMIEHNFVQDKDWDDFRQIFEQVHQEFFQRMQVKAPDLTPADLRLASLIRLNIPSKDISLVLGISPDSLRIARYRLRKKLNLDQGDSLTRFIGSL